MGIGGNENLASSPFSNLPLTERRFCSVCDEKTDHRRMKGTNTFLCEDPLHERRMESFIQGAGNLPDNIHTDPPPSSRHRLSTT